MTGSSSSASIPSEPTRALSLCGVCIHVYMIFALLTGVVQANVTTPTTTTTTTMSTASATWSSAGALTQTLFLFDLGEYISTAMFLSADNVFSTYLLACDSQETCTSTAQSGQRKAKMKLRRNNNANSSGADLGNRDNDDIENSTDYDKDTRSSTNKSGTNSNSSDDDDDDGDGTDPEKPELAAIADCKFLNGLTVLINQSQLKYSTTINQLLTTRVDCSYQLYSTALCTQTNVGPSHKGAGGTNTVSLGPIDMNSLEVPITLVSTLQVAGPLPTSTREGSEMMSRASARTSAVRRGTDRLILMCAYMCFLGLSGLGVLLV